MQVWHPAAKMYWPDEQLALQGRFCSKKVQLVTGLSVERTAVQELIFEFTFKSTREPVRPLSTLAIHRVCLMSALYCTHMGSAVCKQASSEGHHCDFSRVDPLN